METISIDALCAASLEDIYPGLTRVVGPNSNANCAEMDELYKLLNSLHIDSDTSRKFSNCALDILTAGDEQGFRRGFRLAARLFLECGLDVR